MKKTTPATLILTTLITCALTSCADDTTTIDPKVPIEQQQQLEEDIKELQKQVPTEEELNEELN